jgi:hypothetical protein
VGLAAVKGEVLVIKGFPPERCNGFVNQESGQ